MGRTTRIRPSYLPEKLTKIRLALDLSQTEMLRRLGLDEIFPYFVISKNEIGTREPTAIELLAYARVANVLVEVLIDVPERHGSSGDAVADRSYRAAGPPS